MFFFIFVTILTLILFFSEIYFIGKDKTLNRTIKGPTTIPLAGNAHLIAKDSPGFFKAVDDLWKNYGTRFRIYIGNELLIFLTEPKDIESVLSNNKLIDKSTDYEFLKPWLGTGLLTSSGNKWRQHRKIITPTFHFKILEQFIQVFETQSDILVQKLKKHVDGNSFDLFPHITLCALDIISEASMGVSINAQNNSESEYVKAVKDVCRISIDRIKNPLKRLDFMFWFTQDYRQQKKSLEILHGVTHKMIAERRRLLEMNKLNLDSFINNDSDIYGIKRKLAFLDMLLMSTIDGKPLDDTSIREEVDTFLFEGHDTTTSGIVFALYLIAHNPEVQKKLFEEQQTIYGDDLFKTTTYNDLQNMKYMDLAIKEALRLYPPVPIIGRKVVEDTDINDMHLSKNCTIGILVYQMNRNPQYFPDPDKFIPERFMIEETSKRNPFSTVSFSAGPRNCIGQKFAILEMKSTISKVIRNYELLPSNEPIILTSDLILKSHNGTKIKIIQRKY